jgi:hypothetical protein
VKKRALKRRYGRAKAGSGKIKAFRIVTSRFGPEAHAYDYRGHVVNVINGVWGKDTAEEVRRAARKHWPSAKERA